MPQTSLGHIATSAARWVFHFKVPKRRLIHVVSEINDPFEARDEARRLIGETYPRRGLLLYGRSEVAHS